jgi:hypothetical protein
MIEIFSHDLSVRGDDDAPGVYTISGKGWENEPFILYLNEEEAKNLIWQLIFFIDNPLDGIIEEGDIDGSEED